MKICFSILSSCLFVHLLFMEHYFVLIGRLTLSCSNMLGCTSPWFGSCLQARLFPSSSSVDIASSLSTLADSRCRLGLPPFDPPSISQSLAKLCKHVHAGVHFCLFLPRLQQMYTRASSISNIERPIRMCIQTGK